MGQLSGRPMLLGHRANEAHRVKVGRRSPQEIEDDPYRGCELGAPNSPQEIESFKDVHGAWRVLELGYRREEGHTETNTRAHAERKQNGNAKREETECAKTPRDRRGGTTQRGHPKRLSTAHERTYPATETERSTLHTPARRVGKRRRAERRGGHRRREPSSREEGGGPESAGRERDREAWGAGEPSRPEEKRTERRGAFS